LKGVAYRMLGSLVEADDAVQESWLRLSRTGVGGVENLGGWLTTVVSRVECSPAAARQLASRAHGVPLFSSRSRERTRFGAQQ
jgi:DNA-directed RNA polymerase specialized sigma24 family protein